jgi:hypothetical protein
LSAGVLRVPDLHLVFLDPDPRHSSSLNAEPLIFCFQM